MSGSNYGKTRLKQSLYAFILGKSLSSAIGIALILLVVRYLDIPNYSAYITFVAMMEIVHLFSNLGTFAAAYRYIPLCYSQHKYFELSVLLKRLTYFRFATLLSSVVLLFLFIRPLASFLNIESYLLEAKIFLLVIAFEGLARYIDMILDSMLMQKSSQLLVLTRNGLRLIMLVCFYCISEKVELINVVYIELIASLLGFAASFIYILKLCASLASRSKTESFVSENSANISISPFNKYLSKAYFSELISVFTGVEFARVALSKIGQLFEIAAFGFISSVFLSIRRYIPVFLFQGMIRPLFVDFVHNKKGDQKLRILINVVFKVNLHILVPFIISAFLFGDELVMFLSGGKFSSTGIYLTLFLFLLLFQMVHALIGFVLVAYEDSRTQFNGLSLAVLIVSACYVSAFYSEFKVISLALGLICAELIWCLYAISILAKKGIRLGLDFLSVGKLGIISFLMILVVNYLSVTSSLNDWHILLKLTLVTVSYYLITIYFKIFGPDERSLINSMLPRPVFVW